jgi:hypothetical protein
MSFSAIFLAVTLNFTQTFATYLVYKQRNFSRISFYEYFLSLQIH